MRRILILAAVVGLLLPATARAQTLVVSQNKCKLSEIGYIRAFSDSALVPIAQELVDEGKLLAFGSAYHWWGDEWNVLYYYVAEDIPTFLSAFSELFSRVSERYPDGVAAFQSRCFEHKDSMYALGNQTESPSM